MLLTQMGWELGEGNLHWGGESWHHWPLLVVLAPPHPIL